MVPLSCWVLGRPSLAWVRILEPDGRSAASLRSCFTVDVENERSTRNLLDKLANDPSAVESRSAVCEAVSAALTHLGKVLWLTGYVVGPDRKSGESPFKFGDDRAVGIATVVQIGGELGTGTIQLLRGGNRYAASALIRQIVEVEYLAHAFAAESDEAAEWLRAGRKERLAFWSPSKLRKRSANVFLASDYSQHCERGGHPTTEGMSLLPHHDGLGENYLWVDLAGHLASVWKNVEVLAERLLGGPIPAHWKMPDVAAALSAWHRADDLYAALGDLARRLHDVDASGSS